jgi:hypothetical protein
VGVVCMEAGGGWASTSGCIAQHELRLAWRRGSARPTALMQLAIDDARRMLADHASATPARTSSMLVRQNLPAKSQPADRARRSVSSDR